MSLLLPDGIDHLADLPYQLFDAIRRTLTFLGWEELGADEQPPRAIWFHRDELRKHFQAVKRRREEKYGGTTEGVSTDIDGPVQENDLETMLGMSR